MTGAAACILSAVLSANQAAALPAASVPYLVAQGPLPLRFARPRPVAPPPPPPPEPVIEGVSELIEPPPLLSDPADNPPVAELEPRRPRAEPQPVNSQSGEAELLPDTFAPPGGVKVEQLLPYFLPPPALPSRATYEQK